jgi:hypothetical protein
MMLIPSLKGLATVMILACAQPSLLAQEIVHAMVGTVTEVDPTSSSITLQLSDRASASFDFKPDLSAPVSFDKTLREEPETASKLPTMATHVIVYYYGLSPVIAIAVKDMGNKVDSITGTITNTNEAGRYITIQSETGHLATCSVSNETTVETPYGAVDGSKYSPKKGDQVSAVCNYEDGRELAQFIHPLDD